MIAIYQLNTDTGEATGVVRYFCSLECATGAQRSEDLVPPQYSEPHEDHDAPPETVCEHCGLSQVAGVPRSRCGACGGHYWQPGQTTAGPSDRR